MKLPVPPARLKLKSAVGDDPWPYSSMRTPTLVFEGVQLAGV